MITQTIRFADALLELGDQIDLNEWEAIDQSEYYNVDSNITENGFKYVILTISLCS
jgi:hypothetical protein